MATFARINEQNIVVEVVKLDNSLESIGAQYLSEMLGGRWIQTAFKSGLRKNTASIGMIYNETEDCFENHHQAYPSWIFDNNLKRYVPPVPIPGDGDPKHPNFGGKLYSWDESQKNWKLIGQIDPKQIAPEAF
jgi:hypothetical protein